MPNTERMPIKSSQTDNDIQSIIEFGTKKDIIMLPIALGGWMLIDSLTGHKPQTRRQAFVKCLKFIGGFTITGTVADNLK